MGAAQQGLCTLEVAACIFPPHGIPGCQDGPLELGLFIPMTLRIQALVGAMVESINYLIKLPPPVLWKILHISQGILLLFLL